MTEATGERISNIRDERVELLRFSRRSLIEWKGSHSVALGKLVVCGN